MDTDIKIFLVLMVVVNIPVFYLLRRLLFETWGDFWDAIRFWIQPDSLSFFSGELDDDLTAEIKLGLLLLLFGGCLYGEIYLVNKLVN